MFYQRRSLIWIYDTPASYVLISVDASDGNEGLLHVSQVITDI